MSKIEPGDETLPTKLVWLCREINKIYQENKDGFQRNRQRLDAMMTQLSEAEAALSALSVPAEQMENRKAKEAALQAQLVQAKQKKAAYEALALRCEELRSEISALREASEGDAAGTLAALEKEKAALTEEGVRLEREIHAAREETARTAAKPGHSEHQLGLAVDINSHTSDEWQLYAWLAEHAWHLVLYPS